jgi:rhomboid family GlyGly-CTERM serine protease
MLTHNEVWKRYLAPYYPPLSVLLAAALVQALDLSGYLQFDRPAVLEGQIWRLWTAHVAHLGWNHFLLNGAGLWLVWLLFRHTASTAAWSGHFLFACVAVSLGLLWFNPELIWYVGLSGVLHALFIAGLLADIRTHTQLGLLVLLGFAAKLFLEQMYGPLPGSERSAGGPVVVDAHLYGAMISYGILYGFQKLKINHEGTESTKIDT